jgi:hypothetical protein
MQERASEVRRFKKWAGKRSNPDPASFRSDLLTHDDKADILAELVEAEDGAAIDAPFLERLDWSNYP